MRFALVLTFPGLLAAQLIPAGQPVPKGPNPPVVFVNGYQQDCSGSSFASTFFAADKLLQNNAIVTLFFDNCSVGGTANRATLEAEGAAFGRFLASLKYTDGSAVGLVDVVAHSMGGLIVRSYLAGKQAGSPAVFNPPSPTLIRKAIFLATPHFGTPIAALLGSAGDVQLQEMTPGSQFLFDLNTWNQGTDDLRGIDAISVGGNGGAETNITAFDDGVVALTSASLGFYKAGATRVVPDCHTTNTLLQSVGYCKAGTPAIAEINTDPNNMVSQILVSSLTGTNAWKSVGQAAEATASLSATAGAAIQLRDASDKSLPLISASMATPYGSYTLPANGGSGIASTDALSAAKISLQLTPLNSPVQSVDIDLTGSATTEKSVVVKPGPAISPKGVIPAAGPAPFPFDVAPGAYVSIYGMNLASNTQQAPPPYPAQIGDVQVLVNGTPQQLVYVSPGQINFVYQNAVPGFVFDYSVPRLMQLTVKNANGQNTVNVRVAPAVPSIFGAPGAAAAINVFPATVVGPNAPLHEKDFVSLYLTGMGTDTNSVSVTIGGQSIPVLFAGTTAGLPGLNQINCQIPVGITKGSAVPVVVTASGRSSSAATLAIQ